MDILITCEDPTKSPRCHAVSCMGPVIKSHHYLALAVMRGAHLFSTAVCDHKLLSFTGGPEALELMTACRYKSSAENLVTRETGLVRTSELK